MNAQGARFCIKCGSPLAAVAQPQPPAGAYLSTTPSTGAPPPAYDYYAAMSAQRRITEIDRTSTGLLLLLIGIILGPIPYVQYVGIILDIVGVILLIMGRSVFGHAHSRNVVLSVVIYLVGYAIIIGTIVSFVFSVFSASSASAFGTPVNPAAVSQALTSSLVTLLIGAGVGGALTSFAYVLVTYAIQNQTGKMLLWIGYAAGIALGVVTAIIIIPLVNNAISQSFAGTTFNPGPINNLQAEDQLWELLGLIPALFYATALYMVRSRINRGGVLKSSTPTPM